MFGPIQVPPTPPQHQVFMPVVSNTGSFVEIAAPGMVTEMVKIVSACPFVLLTYDEGLFDQWATGKFIFVDGQPYEWVGTFINDPDNQEPWSHDYVYIKVFVDKKWFYAAYASPYQPLPVTIRTIGQ